MAVTETYVDPSIAGDSGTGTIGDPYGDIQFALDTMTRDAANGDRLNIKAGTDEILAAILNLVAYGTPAAGAPLIFQGYIAAAGDGGKGGINAGGANGIFNSSALDHISWIDLNLHNSGGGTGLIRVDDFCDFRDCTFFDGSTPHDIRVGNNCTIDNCSFENSGFIAINALAETSITNCTIRVVAGNGIICGTSCYMANNLIILASGAADGIRGGGFNGIIFNNSVYAINGTGTGIISTTAISITVFNNIVEGFSGVGGVGIAFAGRITGYGMNKFFNNTTNENNTGGIIKDFGNNDTLSASAFLDAASDDFRVTTSVKALAYPTANFPDLTVRTYLDIGALQRLEGATVIVPPVGVSLGQLYNVPAEDRIYEVPL